MAGTVKRFPRKEFDATLKALSAPQLVAKVGWFSNNKYPDSNVPVAYVAAIQEYGSDTGTAHIPARPFMRPTIAAKKQAWSEKMKMMAKRIVNGKMTVAEALEAQALQAEGDFRTAITQITEPALSPVTLQLRKWKKQGMKIGSSEVIAAKVLAAKGLADTSGVSAKPLEDSGMLRGTLTSVVERK